MNNEMKQSIISSTIIKIPSCVKSLKLSPNDWIIPSTSTISCIYFYNIYKWPLYKTESNDLFMNVEKLVASVKSLLEYYTLLGGRFENFDKDYTVSIENDDKSNGILFVSTKIDISLDQLCTFDEEHISSNLFPKSYNLTNTVDHNVLFHIRHSRFSCGSVALTITLNHQIADAHSYFQLIKDWANIYKDEHYRPNVSHERSLLQPSLNDIERLKESNINFDDRKSLAVIKSNPSLTSLTNQNITKVFRFSANELNRMKSHATKHLLLGIEYVSTFDVLTAHLYQHVMIARNQRTLPITKLYISTNTRPRLTQPSIPTNYFGNAIMLSYLEMNMLDLIDENHLGILASQVHRAIEMNTNDDIRTTLAWITCQNEKKYIMPTWNLNETDFTISAWNKMGMYSDSDFEPNVYPQRITLPSDFQFNGSAILFSTEKNDSSIDIVLGLDVVTMERLESNPNFRKYY